MHRIDTNKNVMHFSAFYVCSFLFEKLCYSSLKNHPLYYIYIYAAVCTHCDATLARQLLLGLFGWIRIAQMTIEILVKYFGCLLAKIATFTACIKETGT